MKTADLCKNSDCDLRMECKRYTQALRQVMNKEVDKVPNHKPKLTSQKNKKILTCNYFILHKNN